MNKNIKSLFKQITSVFNGYRKDISNEKLFQKLKYTWENVNFQVNNPKEKYFAQIENKLCNINKSSRIYWFILEHFLNHK